LKDAQKKEKEIQKYCFYGAEGRVLRAEELLNELCEIMRNAKDSSKGKSDVGSIHAIYMNMRNLVAQLKQKDKNKE
jgi:hypothetical protein